MKLIFNCCCEIHYQSVWATFDANKIIPLVIVNFSVKLKTSLFYLSFI